MAGVPNREPHKYSGLLAGPDGALAGVAPRGSDQPSYHFFGVQVAEAAAFDTVPADTPYESVAALYPALNAARPGSVRVLPTDARRITTSARRSTTTPRRWRLPSAKAPAYGAGCRVAPTASVRRSILWDDVEIGDGADARAAASSPTACRIPPRHVVDAPDHPPARRRAGARRDAPSATWRSPISRRARS